MAGKSKALERTTRRHTRCFPVTGDSQEAKNHEHAEETAKTVEVQAASPDTE